jgi:hypothetical protein
VDKPFFCISAYQGNFEILDFADDYKIYVKNGANLSETPLGSTVIENYGYNIYAYLKFIIENYNTLPDQVLFTKNNIFPRHMSRECFSELLINRSRYMFDASNCVYRKPFAFVNVDGRFSEFNNSWYVARKRCRYFGSLNEFLSHFFDFIDLPVYVQFPPGGNILVSKGDILNRPLEFYQRMICVFDYAYNAPETFFVERCLDIIFDVNVKTNNNFDKSFPSGHLRKHNNALQLAQKVLLPSLITS